MTRDRTIIEGYARWELARQLGRATMLCTEYDISEEESLRWLIQSHRPSRGLNSYSRTLLALDLEPSLQEKARANQQAGGRNKGSSDLTEVKTLDVRSGIARLACTSTGNVTKAKQLRKTAHASIEQAVRTGEISIHKAWLWSRESPEKQLENLRLRRIERGIKEKARALVAQHRAKILAPAPDPTSVTVTDLVRLVSCLSTMSIDEARAFGAVDIATFDGPGKGIYVTEELIRAVSPQQEGFVK